MEENAEPDGASGVGVPGPWFPHIGEGHSESKYPSCGHNKETNVNINYGGGGGVFISGMMLIFNDFQ